MRRKEYFCDCEVIHPEKVNFVYANLPNKDMLDELSTFYQVIGDEVRAKILMILMIEEMCVCDLAVILSRTKSAISHQLSILRENDFIVMNRVGKNVYYKIKDEHIKEIITLALVHIEERRAYEN